MDTSTSPGSPGSRGPSDPDGKRKLIANERIKITATLLNNCAAAALGTGVIVPIAALAYGTAIPKSPYYLLIPVGWLIAGLGLDLFTRYTLREMEP